MQYKTVFHVDQNDEQVFNLAINNDINLLGAIPGQEHDLIMLLNGPAVGMKTRAAEVPFLERIQELAVQGRVFSGLR
jgi:intracellular sulfur oxidation DsrE/DsrF family protein